MGSLHRSLSLIVVSRVFHLMSSVNRHPSTAQLIPLVDRRGKMVRLDIVMRPDKEVYIPQGCPSDSKELVQPISSFGELLGQLVCLHWGSKRSSLLPVAVTHVNPNRPSISLVAYPREGPHTALSRRSAASAAAARASPGSRLPCC
jgi:hypothetical protein